tara:strand:- start:1085 stop:1822 length:738 start_codon:yes stop_codon:yes gene_type:complete
MAKDERKINLQELQALNKPSLTDAATDIIEYADKKGIDEDELVSSLGLQINADGERIDIDESSPKPEDVDDFIRLNSKAKPIAGQSLTNSPDAAKPWERPPLFANPREALEDVTQRIFSENGVKNIAKALHKGASVGNITEILLYQDFYEGKYNPDVMLMLYEPVFYSIMNIGEAANLNYRLDDKKINDLGKDEGKENQDKINSIKDIRKTVTARSLNSNAIPPELKEQMQEQQPRIKSLLAGDK